MSRHATTTMAARSAGLKYFAPAQAERALTLVRRIVADIVAEYPRLLEYQEMIEVSQRYGSVEYVNRLQADMALAVAKLQRYVEELESVGVELRDFGRGMVEFPSILAGREIRLCWQHGEPRLTGWYDPNHAPTSRRPITELIPV